MPSVMHVVSLQQAAGVEAHFAAFVTRAVELRPDCTHGWLNPAERLHEFLHRPLAAVLEARARVKYIGPIKLPSWPRALRRAHCRRVLARSGARTLLVWDRTAKLGHVVDAIGAERCIHWEHGAAWHPGRERERAAYLRRVPVAIANSRAAERVLRLMWGYRGEIRVCRNALRPALTPAAPRAKGYPEGPVRLGVAARLFPVKGVPIVL